MSSGHSVCRWCADGATCQLRPEFTRGDRDETLHVSESDAESTRRHLLLRVRGAPMNQSAPPATGGSIGAIGVVVNREKREKAPVSGISNGRLPYRYEASDQGRR